MTLGEVLNRLERRYGRQSSPAPGDPYEMLLYANAGYPPSEAACSEGFAALKARIGVEPAAILTAADAELAAVLRRGGTLPELRAGRLKTIAAAQQDEFRGDLRTALAGPPAKAKKLLKRFPTIGDPGAEKILLFAGVSPEPAVPSNCIQVLSRLGLAEEGKDYASSYRSAQAVVRAELPATIEARQRAYLLLRIHGETLCKRKAPLCAECPLADGCRYVAEGAGPKPGG